MAFKMHINGVVVDYDATALHFVAQGRKVAEVGAGQMPQEFSRSNK